ncbi:HtaA domain-containing protein [Streptomyces sp. ADMS]|uniref:HtaA domain-containing protein n=1 Tax=Streptomyces sp. ADMS TaxID=3071415 RepID=UPI00296F1607|nr:HtaA domain-containing protein [Streptomyces sp. ADMS]MDW4909375.1 HtaA domain-containing protein [Streptomyces sp. ADMS]
MPAHLRALVTVLCAAVLGALFPAGAAHAASLTVQGGRLDWGIKSSFQSYVTGPIAKGSFSLTGGAATVGGSQFRFHSATGTYDGDTGAFRAGFSGGVHFLGHRKDDGTHQLDLTITRPTVRISGGAGTLYVDVVSKAKGSGTVTTASRVPFASLTLGGIDMRGGGNAVVLDNLPARLTAEGARSFAGYYEAGTELDPVSLSADVRAAPAKQPTATPTTEAPAAPASKSPSPKVTSGAIRDGAVDWGVRRTFREYVTGDIAKGRWTLSAGAQDGGALFRFPGGEGTYEDGKLTASFTGAVRFTGENGLDLALSGLRAAVAANGTGTLYADVTSPDFTGADVPLITFTAGKPAPRNGLVALTEAPAKLTGRGAKAFGGMYKAGTEMDPVSLTVALTDDAELPALPDLGSAGTGTETSATPEAAAKSAAPDTENAASDTASGSDDGSLILPVGLAAGSLLLVAAAFAVVARRRGARRAADAPNAPAEA